MIESLQTPSEPLPKKFLRELVANKDFLHIVTTDVSQVTNNHIDLIWDVGIIGNRADEDKILNIRNDLKHMVRRGVSLGIKISEEKREVYSQIKWFEFDTKYINVWILKRGMKKFDDLMVQNNDRMSQIYSLVENKIESIRIIATEKLDGENSQISYFEPSDQWIIGSKNVTLLCKDLKELQGGNYYNGNRYLAAKKTGYAWFQILEEFKLHYLENYESELYKLKNTLKGNTLLGELICDSDRQHVIKYPGDEIKLYFFGLISKETPDQLCYSPCSIMSHLNPFFAKNLVNFVDLPSKEILSKFLKGSHNELYELKFLPFSSYNGNNIRFVNIEEFNEYLKVLQSLVLTLNRDSEGIVLYLINDKNSESTKSEVIELFKVKTIKYSQLRYLREKLKNLIIEYGKTIHLRSKYDFNKYSEIEIQTQIKQSIEIFWLFVHEFILVCVPNYSNSFQLALLKTFNFINNSFLRESNLIEKKRNDLVKEIYKFKLLFQDSSIYLLSIIVYQQLRKSLDTVQFSRYFFDAYSSFISEVKQQSSIKQGILFDFSESKADTVNPDGISKMLHITGKPLSNSKIEINMPPFLLTWEDIKKMISKDFSLNMDIIALDESLCCLTGKYQTGQAGKISTSADEGSKITVYVRHSIDENYSIYDNQFICCCKIVYYDLESKSDLQEEKQTQIEYRIPLNKFEDDSWKLLISNFIKYSSFLDLKIEKEKNSTDWADLTPNQKLSRKLTLLPDHLPWTDPETMKLFQEGFPLNKHDFEHLLYAIIGSNNADYVLRTFYGYAINNSCLTEPYINTNPTLKNKLECTLVLPAGLPASGKSFVLKDFLNNYIQNHDCVCCESLLTSGKIVSEFSMEQEVVYSVIVPKRNDSPRSQFDLILYVSVDGCTFRILNGLKYNSYSISEWTQNSVNNCHEKLDSKVKDANLQTLSQKNFRKLSKNGTNSMKFIVEFIMKQCCNLLLNSTSKSSREIEQYAPNWYKSLRGEYKRDLNLKLLVLFDMNHTPERLCQIRTMFRSFFLVDEMILYKIFVFVIPGIATQVDLGDYREWPYVWSRQHVLSSILRMAKRTQYSTLKGLTPRTLNIFLSFLISYSKLEGTDNKCSSLAPKACCKLSIAFKFDGCINIALQDVDLNLDLGNEETKRRIDLIYRTLTVKTDKFKLFSGDIIDKNLRNIISEINSLSDHIGSLDAGIKNVSHHFYEELIRLDSEVPATPRGEGNSSEIAEKNLLEKDTDWGFFQENELEVYIKQVTKKFNLTAIIFEQNQGSREKIVKIWDDHRDLFAEMLKGNDGSNQQETELSRVSNGKMHVTCCFFGAPANQDKEDCDKEDPSCKTLLTKKVTSELEILFSKPYIGKSYVFNPVYLVYIHSWKLAFLTVSSHSEFFYIPSSDDHINVVINGKCSKGNFSELEADLKGKAKTGNTTESSFGNPRSNFNLSKFTLTHLLPFREKGHPHITLFSEKFNPVVTNHAITIFGKDFSELKNMRPAYKGVYSFDIKVDETKLKGLLKDNNKQHELSSERVLSILAVNLKNEKIELAGKLEYM
ncbi:hypothetical protein HWI79_796 [Cryptosporidium felis]|nr:hypothetical protein HWI79_796 [Cryptosporidium felis]